MVLELSLRVSWICLLLFSSGACFPATQGDYKYGSDPGSNLQSGGFGGSPVTYDAHIPIVPYSGAASGGGFAAGSNLQSGGSSRPLHLSGGSPVTYDAHIPIVPYSGAASGGGFAAGSNLHSGGSSRPLVGYGSSPTGNLSPSSMAVGSSASHQPSGSHVTYDAHIPIVPYSGAGYASSPAAGSSPMSGGSSGFAYLAGNAGQPSRNTAAGAHGGHFTYGSSPMYGGSSGFAYPSGNAGQPSRNTAAGYNALPYRSPVSGSAHPEGAMASPGFATDGAASDLNAWIEARPFIDLSFLESAEGMPLSGSQETSPPMPSSYIVQSRNGYVRDREAFSHKTYSPEYPEPPVMRSKGMSAPEFVSKGGKKF